VTTPPRSVPLTYRELAAALQAGVFPRERSWIDFKRRLYPEGADAGDGPARERASLELAKDLASMAVLGGYLVYGVKEDKARHLFEVDDMQLPVGLHETVDAVARDRITPPLSVVPTLAPNRRRIPRGSWSLRSPSRRTRHTWPTRSTGAGQIPARYGWLMSRWNA
jgi:hypothetical protein